MTDGRRRRSHASRDRIVAAMITLVEDGHIAPSAELVAKRAAVGLRTVFRHFTDMESLYAAMTTALASHYELWSVPFAATGWREQLVEAAERRIATYENLLPFKRAADAHRHRSPAIQREHERMLALMRARLLSMLPPATDPLVVETVDLMLSFEVWQRLRGDQGLPANRAREIVLASIHRLTDG